MRLKSLLFNTSLVLQPLKVSVRCMSKISVELNEELQNKLENNELKPRQHPGICKKGELSLPKHIVNGIINATGDYPVKKLIKDGQQLNRYINARHPPPEKYQLQTKISKIEAEVDRKHPPPDMATLSEVKLAEYNKSRESKINRILGQRVIAWRPITYGAYEALVYVYGRSSQEYAILMRIFKEIAQRDPKFKPRSFFDFGSGAGTGMWASSALWKDSIFEYFNVDASRDMNDLSDLILREGSENKETCLKNVFYRQFLPAAETKYDLVISSFSLFELPSSKDRKQTIMNLWRKCDGYMVLVEEGTRRAFELIDEAKNFVLSLEGEDEVGHVFAPCPHDVTCPRLANLEDKTPCNFEIQFDPVGSNFSGKNKALYSYVVLKKGPRSESDEHWPRVIRPLLVRSKHSVCRMCTAEGKLQEVVFTASKHGKLAYRCARSSRWGDRIPIKILGKVETENEGLE